MNMMQPSLVLLCKLGSIAVHMQEFLSQTGHTFDLEALNTLLTDAEVIEWLAMMDAAAMVPKKRTEPPNGEREALIARLHECTNRIGSMCGDGRPPRMSVPVQENDDDIFITRACLAAADMLAADAPQARELSDEKLDDLFMKHMSTRVLPDYREFARTVLAARSKP